jgi:hypothetical protein
MYFSPSYYVSLGRRCFPGLLETLRRREKDGRQQAEAAATAICVKMGDGTHVVDLLCVCFSSFLSTYIYIYTIYIIIMLCHIISYYTILCYVMLVYIMLYYIIFYYVMLYYIILHHTTLYYIILYDLYTHIFTYIFT